MDRCNRLRGGLVGIEFPILSLLSSIARDSGDLMEYCVTIDCSNHRINNQVLTISEEV
jgi:hypothetical protein